MFAGSVLKIGCEEAICKFVQSCPSFLDAGKGDECDRYSLWGLWMLLQFGWDDDEEFGAFAKIKLKRCQKNKHILFKYW